MPPPSEQITLSITLRRLGYRVAYRLLRLYWLFAQPDVLGVKCAVIDGDAVLLVRHTYGFRGWDFPGGVSRRREPPLLTARREMREELGLESVDWRPIGQAYLHRFRRQDTIHCFQARLRTPALTLDAAELERAQWFAWDQVPADRGPLVDQVIALTDCGTPPPA